MRWLLVVLLALGAWGEPRRVVSGEFEDVDLVFAIKVLAREMGRNVYIGPGVEGKVTLSLRSVPPEGALAMLLGDEFDYKVVSNGKGGQTLIVAPPEKLATIPEDVFMGTADRPIPACGVTRIEIQLRNRPAGPVQELLAIRYPNVSFTRHPTMNAFYIDGSREDKLAILREIPKLDVCSEPPVRELVEVRYGDVAEVKALLATLVPDVTYAVNAEERTLGLDGPQGAVDQVKELLEEFDRPTDQIILDSKLVPLNESKKRAYGRLGPSPDKLTVETLAREPFVITADLRYLVSQSEAKVIAAPRTAVQSGQSCRLALGRSEHGVELTCLPQLGSDGYVSLTLSLQVSEPGGTRRLEKFIRVKSGDTLVVRGLVLPGGVVPQAWLKESSVEVRPGDEVVWMLTPHVMK